MLVAGMLAPDGRCKTLDVAADGYVRAENCIVLVLEALSDDMGVHAIMCGSAIRQVCSYSQALRMNASVFQSCKIAQQS